MSALRDRLAARGVPVLGDCDVDRLGRPCGVPVIRSGFPPHGGPVSHDHGYLTHADGWTGGGRHFPHVGDLPAFVPGPRCTVPGHDH